MSDDVNELLRLRVVRPTVERLNRFRRVLQAAPRDGARQLVAQQLARLAGATAAHLDRTAIEPSANATLLDRGGRLRHTRHAASIQPSYSEYGGAPRRERALHLLQTSRAAREVHQ